MRLPAILVSGNRPAKYSFFVKGTLNKKPTSSDKINAPSASARHVCFVAPLVRCYEHGRPVLFCQARSAPDKSYSHP
jgi:hypothetical protein